jgi:hypothetical protein
MKNYFYIGRTSDFVKRKSRHLIALKENKHPNKFMRDVFSKHGENEFSFNIIFKIDDNEKRIKVEQRMIDLTINYKNSMNINDSAINYSAYGKENSQARSVVQINDNGDIVRKYDYIRETIDYGFESTAVSMACKGKIKSHKGHYWMYLEDYEKNGFIKDNYINANLSHKKSVVQIDLNGNVIKIFNKIIDVEENGFSSKNVSYVCNGKRKSCGGYLWAYLTEFENEEFDIDKFLESKINKRMLTISNVTNHMATY